MSRCGFNWYRDACRLRVLTKAKVKLAANESARHAEAALHARMSRFGLAASGYR